MVAFEKIMKIKKDELGIKSWTWVSDELSEEFLQYTKPVAKSYEINTAPQNGFQRG